MAHTLLIVDDEPRIFQALRRALHREQEWNTVYAESGDAALELLESEPVDLVIVDENMPGMSGTSLLGAVRQRWPDVIRMMLTGDSRVDVLMNAVNRGEIYRFFSKPCNEAELIIAIRDALRMRKLRDESRRLLEHVKEQSARIRRLEGGDASADSDADLLTAGPQASAGSPSGPSPTEGQRASLSLDEITRKGRQRKDDTLELGERGPGDIDALLHDIRSELDRLL